MNLFDLFVKISANTKEAEGGIDATGEKMKDVAKSAGDMAKSVGEAFKKVGEAAKEIDSVVSGVGDKIVKAFAGAATAVGGFAVGLAKAGVEYNAQMETYQMAFTTLLGSAEEARSAMAQIQADAASTPFDVAGLTQANQLLVGAGVSAEEARNVIMALGDAVSATGGGNDELSRMAANLQQIKNVGQASAMDVKQFAMAGINIYQVLADSMGITVDEASQLKPTYEQLSAALVSAASEGGRYFGAMANQSLTFNGQISNLQDNWSALLGSVTGGLQTILQGDILPRIIGYVDEIQSSFNAGGFSGLAETLGNIFADALNTVLGYLPGFVAGVTDTLVSLVSSIDVGQLVSAFQQVVGSIFSAFDEILPMLAPMVEQIVPALAQAFIQYQGMLREIGVTVITAIAAGIGDNAADIVGSVIAAVSSLAETINRSYPTFIGAGKRILQAIAEGLSQNADGITGAMSRFVSVFGAAIDMMLPSLIAIGAQILSIISTSIVDNIGTVATIATMIVMELLNAFSSFDASAFTAGVMTILEALVKALTDVLPTLIVTVTQIVSDLLVALTDPSVIQGVLMAAIAIIGALADGLMQALPTLIAAGTQIVQNLIAWIADPANITTAAQAAIAIVTGLIEGLSSMLPQVAEAAVGIVRALAEALFNPDAVTQIINVAFELISALVKALVDAAPAIGEAAAAIVTGLVEVLTGPGNIVQIISTAFAILQALSEGLLQAIPELLQAAVDIIMSLCQAFLSPENLERLAQAAVGMIDNLANGLIEAVPVLLTAAVGILTGFAGYITDPSNLSKMAQSALQIIKTLATGIINAISLLIEAAANCLSALANAFVSFDWSGTGHKIVEGIKNGITNAWSALKEWMSGLIGDLVSVGGDVVNGVKEGISNAWNSVKSLVRGKSESIEDTARDALDTHSPSRVMMRVGRDVVDGLIVGWNDRMKLLQQLVNDDAHALGVGMYGSDFARTPYEGSTAYAAAAVARDFAPEAAVGGTYTINIQLDGQTIASAVFDPLRAEAKRRGEALA